MCQVAFQQLGTRGGGYCRYDWLVRDEKGGKQDISVNDGVVPEETEAFMTRYRKVNRGIEKRE